MKVNQTLTFRLDKIKKKISKVMPTLYVEMVKVRQGIRQKTSNGVDYTGLAFRPYSKSYKKKPPVNMKKSARMLNSMKIEKTENSVRLYFRGNRNNFLAYIHNTGEGKMPRRTFFHITQRQKINIRKAIYAK